MASQQDLTNVAISSGYATLIHTEESSGVSSSFTTLYDGDGTLIPMAFATTGVKIIDGSYDFDIASHDGTNGLKLGGTLVTTSATELNLLDGITAGTVSASKFLLVDSNKDLTGIRNLTGTGTAQFANFTSTGNSSIGDSVANDTVAFNATITTNLVFEGSTANDYETTLAITDPTADRTWTIPDSSDTFVGLATTDTLTNKTLTAPDINTPDIDGGTVDAITSLTVANNVDIGSYDLRAGTLTADGLTSGRVVFAGTNGVLSDDSDLSFSGATLSATNMTSSGTVTYGSLSDGSITVTAFVDEDGMDSNSATLVPTQQSVKAYVDAQVTAQDLDFQGDSGGALNIDLDSETLDIAGGTGIDTVGSSNTLTVAIDSTVATLAGSQTLSNKTLASPVITTQFNIGSATITEAELEILDGANTTTAELNIIDGDTSATSTTLADADRVVVNDNGTMVQVALTDFETYFETALDTLSNVTTVGAVDSGSLTSGFGNISIGSSTITNTGAVDLGATTVDSLSVSDGNITNVGSIALDSISADDTSIQFNSPIDFNSQNMTEVDIDSGTIDGATIATSNITVGSGKTLDVSAGTLTLADNQISGDKVEGGTIAGTTITALTTAGITASGNLDIGSHGFRASTLTADSQTSGRVAIYGTNGLLTEDSDLTFSGSTLSATNVNISGTLTTTGSVQEVSTTNLNVEDPLILLNKYDSQPSNNAFDAGFVIKRGSGDSGPANVAMIWDESANTFSLIDTSEDGTTAGNVSITDYENLRVGALTADDASTFTSTISTATGSTIGNLTFANGSITDSSGAISFGNENLSTSGTLGAGAITGTSFVIGSADIGEAELEILDGATVTTAELNIMDGDTSATSTTVADADRVVMNDGGTMKQVAVTDLSAYFDDEITAMPNLASVGTLTALQVDNININGNTIISSDTNGHINLTPNGSGEVNISKVDIDAGTIDGATIATSDVTVGSGKTLDVSGGTLTLADDQIPMAKTAIVAGTGISLSTNTLNVDASQTGLESLLNASLVAGRDADNQIKFSTDDQIIFRVAGGDGVTMKASGEIEATSLDISGAVASSSLTTTGNIGVGSTSTTSPSSASRTLRIQHDTGSASLVLCGDNNSESAWDILANVDGALEIRKNNYPQLNMVGGTGVRIEAGGSGATAGSPGATLHTAHSSSTAYNGGAEILESAIIQNTNGSDGSGVNNVASLGLQVASGATSQGFINYVRTGDNTGDFTFSQRTGSSSYAEHMRIASGGNVGIGTTSPAYTLDLASSDAIVSQFTGSSGETILSLDNTSTNGDKWYLISGGSGGSFSGGKFGIYNADTTTAVATFTNSGNVGIGTTSPAGLLEVENSSGDCNVYITAENASNSRLYFGDQADVGAGFVDYDHNGNTMKLGTNGTTRLTVGTDLFYFNGNVGINETSPLNKFYVVETESKAVAAFYNTRNPSSSPPHGVDINFAYTPDNTTSYFVRGQDNLSTGSPVAEFHIYSDGSFAQSSDRRMKENIVDSANTLDKVNKLKVKDYNKINDSSKKKHIGFIAQELQEVFPHLVIEAEDEAKTLQIYKIGIVPLLVKAVQELSAKVEALENA